MRYISFFASLLVFLSGCGISVIPIQPADKSAIISNDTITSQRGGVMVSAKIVDLEIPPYRSGDNIASIFVDLKNNTSNTVNYSNNSFLLVDTSGKQYYPLEPEKIKKYFERDSSYLIPYPFVGYYYLQDKIVGAQEQSIISDSNYYYVNRPQNLLIDALPIEPLLPLHQASGLLFYRIDFYKIDAFSMKVYLPGESNYIEFPFKVVR